MSLPLAERKAKPESVTAPALAVVSVDGGRLQIRREAQPAAAATPPADADGTEGELPPDDKHRGKHWREDKIGLLMTMTSAAQASDPCPQVPAAFVDPTRIAKLVRELKARKSARQEPAGGPKSPQEPHQVRPYQR